VGDVGKETPNGLLRGHAVFILKGNTMLKIMLLSMLCAVPATKPAPVIPVPASSEAYLALSANRDKLAAQIEAMSARLAAIDEALAKADGAKKEKAFTFPHYFTEDQSMKIVAVQVGDGRKGLYLRGFLDVDFADDAPGKYEVRWRYQVNRDGAIGWREYKTKLEAGIGKKQSAFRFDATHVSLRNSKRWDPINAHVLILKDDKPYCETLWKPADKLAKYKPDGKAFWWDDEFATP
jgi:hypothetical protein